MGSLRVVHPEWDQYVLLVDEIREAFDPAKEPFAVVEVSQLPIPQRKKFYFRYTILELNTAVKPWLLEWLFNTQGCDQVVYLDPDIFVYRPLVEVEEALDSGAFMVITPHLTGLLDNDKKPSEREIVQAGAYNLGFIALARHDNLYPFLNWWQRKLEFDCVVDFPNGLFVDQKWIDLAPGMFSDVSILRHEGYNVAYWNLQHRTIVKLGDKFFVNYRPLVFFHFSGLNPKAPDDFSKHQNRFRLKDLGAARELVNDYCEAVKNNGLELWESWPYAFGQYTDGTPILDVMRSYYRKNPKFQVGAGEDPFDLDPGYFHLPWGKTPKDGPLVTILMRLIWESKVDLRVNFPDIDGTSRLNFAHWFVERGALEYSIPEYLVTPVRDSLSKSKKTSGDLGFGVNYSGFYDLEEFETFPRSVWMGAAANVRIPSPGAGGTLKIAGEYQAEFYEIAHNTNETLVDVLWNEIAIGQIVLEESGPFERTLAAPDLGLSHSPVLSLAANHVFVPAAIGINGDTRVLSIKISKIILNDDTILDFSYPDAPFIPENGDTSLDIGVNIIGYVKSELGVGQSARLCAGAAESVGIPFSLYDFNVGCASRASDETWVHMIRDDCPFRVNLFHINADQMSVVHASLGQKFFDGHYNIGYWHWELPEFPDRWLPGFAFLNEIWVPSQFVMDTVSRKSPIPVVRMPHAIRFAVDEMICREQMGLPADAFLFLTMYDMASSQARKNPQAVIETFCKAFPHPGKIALVIKVMNTEIFPAEFADLQVQLAAVPGILLINKTLARQAVYNLEARCDCFVSLHRSEGFGLGLAECMYLGKPVIGTHWSGNVDFMNHKNSCPVDYRLVPIEQDSGPYKRGQIWAEADVEQAAWYMRKLVQDPAWGKKIAVEGQHTIRTSFSPEVVGQLYRKRLGFIAKSL